MAGAIAHHFNNQLQSVMLSLELTQQELATADGAVEYVTAAMESARKAAGMSSLMLTYLGQTATEPAPLDLAGICQRELPGLRAALPGEVELTGELPLPGPIVHADAKQIRQVLDSLASAGLTMAPLAVSIAGAGIVVSALTATGMTLLSVLKMWPATACRTRSATARP